MQRAAPSGASGNVAHAGVAARTKWRLKVMGVIGTVADVPLDATTARPTLGAAGMNSNPGSFPSASSCRHLLNTLRYHSPSSPALAEGTTQPLQYCPACCSSGSSVHLHPLPTHLGETTMTRCPRSAMA